MKANGEAFLQLQDRFITAAEIISSIFVRMSKHVVISGSFSDDFPVTRQFLHLESRPNHVLVKRIDQQSAPEKITPV